MRGCCVVLLVLICTSLCLADPPVLVLYPRQMQFPAAAEFSGDPSSYPLLIRNGSHADMEWSSQIVTSTGGDWLKLTPASGTVGPPPPPLEDGPSSFQARVNVSSAGLKIGVYTGTITITSSRLYQGVVYPATDSPQTVNVTYTVYETATPSVRVSGNNIVLAGVAGIGSPSESAVAIGNAGPGTLIWSASIQNPATSAWLTVTPASGVNSGMLRLQANPGLLAAGVYSAHVSVSSPGSPTQTIAVTYNVRAPKPATVDVVTTPLNFTASSGTSPAAQSLSIVNSGEVVLNWKAVSTTFNGGQWLSVGPAAGTNNGTIVISPSASTLAPGVYVGRVMVASDSARLQAQLQVNFTVSRAVPTLTGGGFFNAASLIPDGVVACSLASIFGTHLGPDDGQFSVADSITNRFPTFLGGTRVTVDGMPAPLFYVSATQINLQIPCETVGKTFATAHVEADGYDPADFKIGLVPANVGIFTVDRFRAAALNRDGTLNASDNPAAAGTVVQFYATGQGLLDIPVLTGSLSPSQAPFPAPLTPVTVQIGGRPAKILFSGLAPGTVGMLQLNVQIPAGTPPSDLTVVQTQTGMGKLNTVYIATSAAQ